MSLNPDDQRYVVPNLQQGATVAVRSIEVNSHTTEWTMRGYDMTYEEEVGYLKKLGYTTLSETVREAVQIFESGGKAYRLYRSAPPIVSKGTAEKLHRSWVANDLWPFSSNTDENITDPSGYRTAIAKRFQIVRILDMELTVDLHFYPLRAESLARALSSGTEVDVIELLCNEYQNRLCLFGPSGAGKTTCVRRLLWESIDSGPNIFFISLRDYPYANTNDGVDIRDWLDRSIQGYDLDPQEHRALSNLIRKREGIFIFDGFDELRADPRWATKIAESIEAYFANYTKCKVVITSRAKEDLRGHFQGFSSYHLKALTTVELPAFFSKLGSRSLPFTLPFHEINEGNLFDLRPVMLLITMVYSYRTDGAADHHIGSLFQLLDTALNHLLLELDVDRREEPPPHKIQHLLPEERQYVRMQVLQSMVRNWPQSARPCQLPRQSVRTFLASTLAEIDNDIGVPSLDVLNYMIPTGICLELVDRKGEILYGFVHNKFQEFLYAKILLHAIQAEDANLLARDYYSAEILELLGEALSVSDVHILMKWASDTNMDLMTRKVSLGALGFVSDRPTELIPKLQELFDTEMDIGVAGRIAEALRRLGVRTSTVDFIDRIDQYPPRVNPPDPSVDNPSRPLIFEIDQPLVGFEDGNVESDLLRYLENRKPEVRKHSLITLMRLRSPIAPHLIVRYCMTEVECIEQTTSDVSTQSTSASYEHWRSLRYGLEALGRYGNSINLPFVQRMLERLVESGVPLDPAVKEQFNDVTDRLSKRDWLPPTTLLESYKPAIFLIRHGESLANVEGRLLGSRFGGNLTDRGSMQAQKMAHRLRHMVSGNALLVSGPADRATATARQVAKVFSCTLNVDPLLTELDYGEWSNQLKEEIRAIDSDRFARWQIDGNDHRPPHGESLFEVKARTSRALSQWLKEAIAQHRDLIIVTHYFPLAMIYEALFGEQFEQPDNCAITCIRWYLEGWEPVCRNDSEHLQEVGYEKVTWS